MVSKMLYICLNINMVVDSSSMNKKITLKEGHI